MAVRAVRGAIQVEANDRDIIREASAELVQAVLDRNDIDPEDMISVLFTVTLDLDTEFPAVGARQVGLTQVPLMCATEIPVPGALARVIRLMAHIETSKSRAELHHVYLRGATALRPDLAQ